MSFEHWYANLLFACNSLHEKEVLQRAKKDLESHWAMCDQTASPEEDEAWDRLMKNAK